MGFFHLHFTDFHGTFFCTDHGNLVGSSVFDDNWANFCVQLVECCQQWGGHVQNIIFVLIVYDQYVLHHPTDPIVGKFSLDPWFSAERTAGPFKSLDRQVERLDRVFLRTVAGRAPKFDHRVPGFMEGSRKTLGIKLNRHI